MSRPDGEARQGISIRGVTKRYGSTIALSGVDLELYAGEVLGIAGPNGAGKSTLIRVIAGEERPDGGELTFDGAPWSPFTDWQAVAVVHQEPQLFPNLTVAENMLVGREGASRLRPGLGQADARVMEALGIGHLRDRLLSDCSLATQQRTEIARAVARASRVFLFDEPNSALTADESNELFREMHKIAADGRIVLLVTHRLEDLVAHCSRVAIVRDGSVRAILQGEALTEEGIARQMVVDSGAVHGKAAKSAAQTAAQPVFSVKNWTHDRAFRDVSLDGSAGEIIALVGVEGSGSRELIRSFAGLEHCTGAITIAGEGGEHAIDAMSAYVPATRQLSLYSNFSVGENLLARLGSPQIAGFGLTLRTRRMKEMAEVAVKHFLVKTRTTTQPIRSLSGGNQQKVAIAQALHCDPKLLLLEEPTRGVDIHSKAEIYRLLRDYAERGNVVIMLCTETLEVYEAADRVHVVANGKVSPGLAVGDYDHVEQLATDITRLESESRERMPKAG
ncbi:sugar ABC transporter ATP-binding protein [Mesorhizobium sp. BH1-1-5]|uniref:ATP-binding cassette domain-containing protein n=1 Tax=Mesorhizobium sp. BH1-1-5 TaxID=2876661 RepID=UPI001CCB840F|nr:sugar ABC transporter ATP-binding protein [Mesorhizobium sp. BH1-1-5]MBZ9988204.1 sugar ABC transporter ATP-binding protein [Mesorhizobium sp. BH1-1-5]